MATCNLITITGSKHLRGAVIETMEELGFSVNASRDWDPQVYSVVYIDLVKSEIGQCTRKSAITKSMFHIEGYDEITKFFEVIKSVSAKNLIHIKNDI